MTQIPQSPHKHRSTPQAWVTKVLMLFVILVPAEGFEPPTNGLQNRCSTTELSRQTK